MLKMKKYITSVVVGLLVLIMSCSTALAGQVSMVDLKKNDKLEMREEINGRVEKIYKKNVTRKGRCEAIAKMQQYINEGAKYYGGLRVVEVDGLYGPKTRESFIRYWQLEACDVIGDEVIAVDGIFGPKSKELSKGFMLKPNMSYLADHVSVVSAILIWYGYDHPFTSTYTNEFGNAVRRFQRDHGLAADGIVGPDTYYKLFNK